MNRAEFLDALKREGFEVVEEEKAANQVDPEHAHDFDGPAGVSSIVGLLA
jgi:hypothetical protein